MIELDLNPFSQGHAIFGPKTCSRNGLKARGSSPGFRPLNRRSRYEQLMLRLDHVVLPIWEPRESLAFYRELLGLTLVDAHDGDDWGGFPWLMLIFALGDEREVVLVHFAGAERPPRDALPKDGRHLALAETGSLDPWRAKLREAAVDFWEEDHGERQSLYFEDPNGLVLEITSPPAAHALVENTRALRHAARWIEQRRSPR